MCTSKVKHTPWQLATATPTPALQKTSKSPLQGTKYVKDWIANLSFRHATMWAGDDKAKVRDPGPVSNQ
jgi:hypothetical protein